MKINNRFLLAKENKEDVAILLIEKEYNELDSCISEFDEESMVFIDTEKKTYYFLDKECLKSSSEIVEHKFNEKVYPTSLKELQNLL